MTVTATLFDRYQLGDIELANRIVMAPMTRSRAGAGDVPTDLHVEYYRQRATAGLIVTEGTQPSANGKGYCRTPGIHSAEQIAAWQPVTDAVHAEGGRIFLQVMHVGRVASALNKDSQAETVAPSVVRAAGQIYTDQQGMVELDEPRALTTEEIPALIEEFRQATANAYAAGFDGVELHCASGYLPMQFLSTGTNQRSDAYGGSVEHRIRFVVEVLEAMASVDGSKRVGIRICPGNNFNDLQDDDPVATYSALLQAIDPLGLAYLHIIRSPRRSLDAFELGRNHFSGPLILNDSFDRDSAAQTVAAGEADLVSFGRFYISNPDLVRRFREGAPLNDFDNATLYTEGPQGLIDYPSLVD